MSKKTIKALFAAMLSLAAAAALSQTTYPTTTRVRAPEISPAEAMGALALLGGAIAIVRGYRRRPK
jgi:hypothetical protein